MLIRDGRNQYMAVVYFDMIPVPIETARVINILQILHFGNFPNEVLDFLDETESFTAAISIDKMLGNFCSYLSVNYFLHLISE